MNSATGSATEAMRENESTFCLFLRFS